MIDNYLFIVLLFTCCDGRGVTPQCVCLLLWSDLWLLWRGARNKLGSSTAGVCALTCWIISKSQLDYFLSIIGFLEERDSLILHLIVQRAPGCSFQKLWSWLARIMTGHSCCAGFVAMYLPLGTLCDFLWKGALDHTSVSNDNKLTGSLKECSVESWLWPIVMF